MTRACALPRDRAWRFFKCRCPDSKCDGRLVPSDVANGSWGRWHCDGLTYDDETGPLTACEYGRVDWETR